LQYPALTRLLDPLHRFVKWYAESLSTLPTDSLFSQKLEKDFPAAPRPVSGWLQLLAAIRIGDVKQREEDQAGRLLKPPSELIRVGQAAAILNVSENTVRRWADEGLMTAYRVGPRRDRRFHRTEVQQLLNRVEEWTPNLRGASSTTPTPPTPTLYPHCRPIRPRHPWTSWPQQCHRRPGQHKKGP